MGRISAIEIKTVRINRFKPKNQILSSFYFAEILPILEWLKLEIKCNKKSIFNTKMLKYNQTQLAII